MSINSSPPVGCLLITLNSNDDDMNEYAETIISKKRHNPTKNYEITSIDYESIDDLFESSRPHFNQLAVVGHSLYFNENTLEPIPIKKRLLGGLPAIQVIERLADLAIASKTKEVRFYCCETASYQRGEESSYNLPKECNTSTYTMKESLSYENIIKSTQWSTIEFFAYMFLSRLNPYDDRHLTIQGLNGLGYISPATRENPRPKTYTFNQEHLPEYQELCAHKKALTLVKKNKRAEEKRAEQLFSDFETNHCLTFPAPYKLKLEVSRFTEECYAISP